MRRFVIGLICGLLLSISATVYADEVKSLVGRAVEGTFPVNVKGETLQTEAIVIDGTSYLPVRELAEKLNQVVKFDPEKGISLEPNTSNAPEWAGTVIVTPHKEPDKPPATLEQIDSQLNAAKDMLAARERSLEYLKTNKKENLIPGEESLIQSLKSQIAELEKQKVDIEK